MTGSRIRVAALSAAAVLVLTACGEAVSDDHVIVDPATVEEIEGSRVARITLTESAVKRLDIQTVPVRRVGTGTVVPSSAIYLDPEGTFWVYTSPEPLVFIREQIRIVGEDDGRAFLSDGPPPGTDVVTVGVPELYGTETGIGH